MPAYLTLQKISQNLLSELVRSRTDFLLHQTAIWQKFNEEARGISVFAKPDSLDLSHTSFEFCIVRKKPGIFTRILHWFRKPAEEQHLFRLCGEDEKDKIRVTISVRLQPDRQSDPDISTDPALESKPTETYVSGIAV